MKPKNKIDEQKIYHSVNVEGTKQLGMRTKQREVLTRSEVNKYLYRLDSERKRKEKEKDK